MERSVLVVEDDFLVRMTVCHYLENMGWTVRQACDGKTALGLLRGSASRVKAVLTDIRLPDMEGLELHRSVRDGCVMVFMSGATLEAAGLPGPLLRKPFGEPALRAVMAAIR